MKPLIGITAYNYIRPNTDWRYDMCYGRYAEAIERVGGLPVLIPSHASLETVQQIYQRLDGVLLPGGGDVNPDQYDAVHHEKLMGMDDLRDGMELNLTRWAVSDDRPILGICRGLQVMNVALGGTLIQDVPSLVGEELSHDLHESKVRATIRHDVTIDAASRLAKILGSTKIGVNSIHHQSVENPAPSVKITAHAPDGVVEALEVPDKFFAVAVQWHPEDLVDSEAGRMEPLFRAFVEAARERLNS